MASNDVRAVARLAARQGWSPDETMTELVSLFGVDLSTANEITCDELRSHQEREIQAEHDEAAYDAAQKGG